MKNSYEQVVRVICGDNWANSEMSQDDRDGGFGVAMILAYLQGVSPRLTDLSRTIDVPPYLLETAYRRLQINGLFSPRSFVLSDPLFHYEGNDPQTMYDALYAWCFIAGYASGYTGKGFTREEYAESYAESRQG